jgi:hypothetical protein
MCSHQPPPIRGALSEGECCDNLDNFTPSSSFCMQATTETIANAGRFTKDRLVMSRNLKRISAHQNLLSLRRPEGLS